MVPQEWSPGVVPRGDPQGLVPAGERREREKTKPRPRVASRRLCLCLFYPTPKASCLFRWVLHIHTTVNPYLSSQPSMAPLKVWQT